MFSLLCFLFYLKDYLINIWNPEFMRKGISTEMVIKWKLCILFDYVIMGDKNEFVFHALKCYSSQIYNHLILLPLVLAL